MIPVLSLINVSVKKSVEKVLEKLYVDYRLLILFKKKKQDNNAPYSHFAYQDTLKAQRPPLLCPAIHRKDGSLENTTL